MSTAVPVPTFGPTGFVAPLESDILAGRKADLNAAFVTTLNPQLDTPQGQIASSDTAIIGNCDDQFLALANGVDPAYAAGRMQDAIGRIYYLERIPARATAVTARCRTGRHFDPGWFSGGRRQPGHLHGGRRGLDRQYGLRRS